MGSLSSRFLFCNETHCVCRCHPVHFAYLLNKFFVFFSPSVSEIVKRSHCKYQWAPLLLLIAQILQLFQVPAHFFISTMTFPSPPGQRLVTQFIHIVRHFYAHFLSVIFNSWTLLVFEGRDNISHLFLDPAFALSFMVKMTSKHL